MRSLQSIFTANPRTAAVFLDHKFADNLGPAILDEVPFLHEDVGLTAWEA